MNELNSSAHIKLRFGLISTAISFKSGLVNVLERISRMVFLVRVLVATSRVATQKGGRTIAEFVGLRYSDM